ncbi:hypothetical protein [Streptomyces sp. sk226]|uniref:hypothetical protein n=1 Tax=Streptomyces sp. sk226 TaxID=2034268 RepID=UPI000BEF3C0B|nr:hypothetical protein [Streptomyces sp. sk226]
MYGENASPNAEQPPEQPLREPSAGPAAPAGPGVPPAPAVPARGVLLVDTSRGDRVGEFRGVAGPYWSLRPVGGGREWEVEPRLVRPALLMEQLRARTARLNARSRGEVL